MTLLYFLFKQSNISQKSINSNNEDIIEGTANAEEQAIGSIGFSIYKSYFQSLQNYSFAILVFVLFILAEVGISGIDFFVSRW
jgi:hypothetical protein